MQRGARKLGSSLALACYPQPRGPAQTYWEPHFLSSPPSGYLAGYSQVTQRWQSTHTTQGMLYLPKRANRLMPHHHKPLLDLLSSSKTMSLWLNVSGLLYLVMWRLKSPRMVPGAASAESVCPIMALEAQTTLGPSQTCSTEIKVGKSGDHQGLGSSGLSPRPSTPCTRPYHGHHRAGAHVADEGWVEGLPPKVMIVLSKDALRRLDIVGGKNENSLCRGNPTGHWGNDFADNTFMGWYTNHSSAGQIPPLHPSLSTSNRILLLKQG